MADTTAPAAPQADPGPDQLLWWDVLFGILHTASLSHGALEDLLDRVESRP